MFECADTAFLIGAYPSSQVGSGNAVVVCGTLLAAYMQVVETAWYLKCNVYLLIKKLHLVSWRGCPTFGGQFSFQTTFYPQADW
ncbi:hypothetical protein HMPREF3066_07400 [Neisseria sp. HMSC03D10]|nr:hypothetical protein HMPREF3066_07400 [Neisseria sp. HMSC03D10]